MATEVGVAVIAKCAGCIVAPFVRQLDFHVDYLVNFNENVEKLRNQVSKLTSQGTSVQHLVDESRRNGHEIEANVIEWFDKVDEVSSKAHRFFHTDMEQNRSCLNLKTRYRLSKSANKMCLEIEAILSEGNFSRISYSPILRYTGASFNKGYQAFGSRTNTLNRILESLKNMSVKRVGVYGMGGVGKTMLAKEVASRAKADKLFDEVIMAVVSQNPDTKRIQGEIGDKLGLQFNKVESLSGRAAHLRERLWKEKKILVILDGVWEKIDLDNIGISFDEVQQRKCKMLFTSRNLDVLRDDMETQKNFSVGTLSDDEALNLFLNIASEATKNPDLYEIATDIVKKCAGLPIAIATVANTLKNKKLSVWNDALQHLTNSNPSKIKGMDAQVFRSIELSYNILDEESKSLFLLCSLHIEVEDIHTDYLLRYGLGLGLFRNTKTLKETRDRIDTLVDNLKNCCLLLEGQTSSTVKMHEIIRNVAFSIASKQKHMVIVKDDTPLEDEITKETLKNLTAVSFINSDVDKFPERLNCPKLQLFLYFSDNPSQKITSEHIFKGMRKLKLLDLSVMDVPSLPSSVCFLENLQSLCLEECSVGDVSIIGQLKTLEILSFAFSNIAQLPKEIRELTRLRLLNLSDCWNLDVIPCNVLSHLVLLEELYIGYSFNSWEVDHKVQNEESKACLTELDKLSKLTTLEIEIPDPKILPNELFERLKIYRICIGEKWEFFNDFGDFRMVKIQLDTSIHSKSGVKMLMQKCEYLYLAELKGVRNILYELDLEGFSRLKHFEIEDNDEIQYIINSLGKVNPQIAFPVLEKLSLRTMSNLEKICHGRFPLGSFGKLRFMYVGLCFSLKFLFSCYMTRSLEQLEELKIFFCLDLDFVVVKEREEEIGSSSNDVRDVVEFGQLRSLTLERLPGLVTFLSDGKTGYSRGMHPLFCGKVSFPSLKILVLSGLHFKEIWHVQLPSESFSKLRELSIQNCKFLLKALPFKVLKSLTSLEKLEVINCESLEDVFDFEGLNARESDELVFPLRDLWLDKLPSLRCIWGNVAQLHKCLTMLRWLTVTDCHKLGILFAPTIALGLENLRLMEIDNCDMLEEVVTNGGHESSTIDRIEFPKLNSLLLKDLGKLKGFYLGNHPFKCPALTKLTITGCPMMKTFASGYPLFNERVVIPNVKVLELEWNYAMANEFAAFPDDLFCNVKSLKLCYTGGHENTELQFPSSFVQNLLKLEKLHIDDSVFKDIFLFEGLGELDYAVLATLKKLKLSKLKMLVRLWNEYPLPSWVFESLEILDVLECDKLKTLLPPTLSLNNLTTLVIQSKCSKLRSLFSASTAKSLNQLTTMTVSECERLSVIVGNYDGEEANEEICFDKLTYLALHCLPRLTSFCSMHHSFTFSSLRTLIVVQCPQMEYFCPGFLSTPKLDKVQMTLRTNEKVKGANEEQEEDGVEDEEDEEDDDDAGEDDGEDDEDGGDEMGDDEEEDDDNEEKEEENGDLKWWKDDLNTTIVSFWKDASHSTMRQLFNETIPEEEEAATPNAIRRTFTVPTEFEEYQHAVASDKADEEQGQGQVP